MATKLDVVESKSWKTSMADRRVKNYEEEVKQGGWFNDDDFE